MPAHPGRSPPAEPGTSSGSWSSETPSARRSEDEIGAPTTLVEAIHTRSRTWVQFPPSPPPAPSRTAQVPYDTSPGSSNPGDCRSGGLDASLPAVAGRVDGGRSLQALEPHVARGRGTGGRSFVS